MKRATITLTGDVALWVRRKAAEENTSVSKLVSRILERQMRMTDQYWRAYEAWKKEDTVLPGIDAANRLSREDAHER